MKTIRTFKTMTLVNICDRKLAFKTVVSQSDTGILTCMYLTKYNDTDLELVGVGGGIQVMHQWETDADFDKHKRSAIMNYGSSPIKYNGAGKGHILLVNGEHISLRLSSEDTLSITCGEENAHVISITDFAKDLLDVHIITEDGKTVLHKRIYDMGAMVINA